MANTYLIKYNIDKEHLLRYLNIHCVLLIAILLLPIITYGQIHNEGQSAHDTTRVYFKNDTLHIYFDHDKYELRDSFKVKIADIAGKLLNSYNKILFIHGYTDHTGGNTYNKWLSTKRAESVHKALLNSNVPSNLIESIIGRGEIESHLPEYERIPKDRKVVLVLADRNVKPNLSDVNIDSLKKGDEVIIQNLNFKPGRHYFLKESIPRLKELLHILEMHPNLKVELQGHVCCAPNGEDGIDLDTKTQDLSLNRAINIYEYLIRNGIDSTRMTYKAFARTRPIYPEERNNYERKMNRRVEIKVLGN